MKGPRSCVLLVSISVLSAPPGFSGDPLASKPSNWPALRLLDALDPGLRAERRVTVETALEDFPGSMETFLLALLSPGFIASARAAPGQVFGPLDPGVAGLIIGHRGTVYDPIGGPPPEMTIGETGFRMLGYTTESPLILDLDGDGSPGVEGGSWEPHQGLALEPGKVVPFDINGDGFAELTEWVSSGDGLLCESPSPKSGRDLFGTAGGWPDGFRKLSMRDGDHDGIISGDELKGLHVWIDKNRDGAAQDGEVTELSELKITAIRLPQGGPTGTFVRDGVTGTVWDWWPSYALAMKLGGSGIGVDPPTSVALGGRVVVSGPAAKPAILPVDGSGWVSKERLVAAGIDWNLVLCGGLAPDGSSILLYERGAGAAQIAGGSGCSIWRLKPGSGGILATPYRLPVASFHQLVFDTPGSLLVVGENGAKIIRMDLESGIQTLLLEPIAGQHGFRTGDRAFRSGGEVCLTGYFHDQYQNASKASIAVYDDGDFAAPAIVERSNLDEMRSCVRSLGYIVMEYLVSPDLGFFIVQAAGGPPTLVACKEGKQLVLEDPVRPSVLAASGSRVLYMKESPLLPVLPEVFVLDVASGEKFDLGSGDYCYPYLEDEGRVAFVTGIDWAAGTMTFLAAVVGSKQELEPFLSTKRIGALRVSDDGSTYAYLGPEGLKVGPVPGVAGQPFKRGDANADFSIDITDAVVMLSYMFLGTVQVPCEKALDADASGSLEVTDAVLLLSFLFLGGKAPEEPFAICRADRGDDKLTCRSFEPCE